MTEPAGRGRGALTQLVVFAAALAGVLLAATCTGSAPACPAIGWTDQLTIEVDDGWPGAHEVRVQCPSPCGLALVPVTDDPDAATVPLSRGTASVSFAMGAPPSVTATVLAVDGAELTTAELELDWVRVGGTAECGGPHEATAAVPAP